MKGLVSCALNFVAMLLALSVVCLSLAEALYLRSFPEQEGQFWHITDLHLDPTYHITDDHTKVCFSSKGFPAKNPGVFGDYMCDSPYLLIQSAFDYMKNVDLQPKFIIWTGDSPPHVPPEELSTDIVINVIRNMTNTIQAFFPDLQVYPALGNHDYWPQDQLPVSTNKIYEAVTELWKPWLTPEALKTLIKGGFYSQMIDQNLRIISLNTNLYYSPNNETLGLPDPAGQFEWLEEVLQASLKNNEKVYIIAHVPVGYLPFTINTTAMRENFNEKLVEIFRNYSSIIVGQFFGHTHRDSIMVLHDTEGNPVNSLFVAPAVTPIKNFYELQTNNPGFRLYKYNLADYTLLDIWQYYMNLTEANEQKKPDWKLEYIMTKDFNINDLQPKSLHDLVKQFEKPQSQEFQKYYRNFIVSYDQHIVCEGICKREQVCAIQFLDYESYTNCFR
ncbi:acid sphingomyelinase-like phosphodiesterase 3a [Erpetoichthys calabaricus]|uniref:Acid sphingomyelinase-like phosphodiesterase n=1 Tax=Erpetoichthys calabaricus TaxID=27687 RepID=A0A8C4RXP5_ERPCA|nr:acid sphingomyelinase-like phosphodiesterase 3a [Erpetoichthys calabaricus]